MDDIQRHALLQEKHAEADALFDQLAKTLEEIRNKFPGYYDQAKKLVVAMAPSADTQVKNNNSKKKTASKKKASPKKGAHALSSAKPAAIDASASANNNRTNSLAGQSKKRASSEIAVSTGAASSVVAKKIKGKFPSKAGPSKEMTKTTTMTSKWVAFEECNLDDPEGFCNRPLCRSMSAVCKHPRVKMVLRELPQAPVKPPKKKTPGQYTLKMFGHDQIDIDDDEEVKSEMQQ